MLIAWVGSDTLTPIFKKRVTVISWRFLRSDKSFKIGVIGVIGVINKQKQILATMTTQIRITPM
ncbi:hypothetical protein WJD88_24935, partial [Salmonella enterica subsp. enterica serovar Corvallis]